MAKTINLENDFPGSCKDDPYFYKLVSLEKRIRKDAPDFKMVYKSSSLLMKLIYYILFMWLWLPAFMTRFTTTIGKTVYVPDEYIQKGYYTGIYRTLRHEYVHILQKLKYKILFDLSYLFPQILFVLSFLSIFAIWFSNYHLLWLLSLLFLAPIPAPFRALWEYQGYSETILANYQIDNCLLLSDITWIVDEFTSANYWFMFPFRTYMTKVLLRVRDACINGTFVSYIDRYHGVRAPSIKTP